MQRTVFSIFVWRSSICTALSLSDGSILKNFGAVSSSRTAARRLSRELMRAESVWKPRKFEIDTRESLKSVPDGEAHWARYEHARDDIVANVLPYVASQEPGLSDHGVAHIANVIDNIGQVLGLTSAGTLQVTSPLPTIPPQERLLLLMGALLHDVGNILGRTQHNQVTAQVWRESGQSSYERWTPVDRKAVIALCQAHTGRNSEGGDDTLKPLAASQHYFLDDPVPLSKLAATLRFADELAEGRQRTSGFLLFKKLYGAENIDFHRYADATHVIIDRANGRVALNYTIDFSDEGFGNGDERKENLKRLVELIFKRVLKLEKERVFARHYAPDWLAFHETSVVFAIERHHERVCDLQPISLNDFNLRDSDPGKLASIDPGYDVEQIIAEVCGKKGEPEQ